MLERVWTRGLSEGQTSNPSSHPPKDHVAGEVPRSLDGDCGGRRCSAALLAVAGQDVPVGGCDAGPVGTAQPHGFQLGGVRPAAGAGALEGLLEHGAEGDQGVRAGGVTAVPLAARQQHDLEAHQRSRRECIVAASN